MSKTDLKPTQRSKVLVIEDEDDVRDLVVLHLKREGYQVVAEEDAEKALVHLRADSASAVDLAVVDWMLPDMSGLDLTRWIREQKLSLPVLMVTARADSTDIVRGLESGADDYVTKPFEIPVFLARVRSLIRRSRLIGTSPEGVDVESDEARLKIGELELDGASYDVMIAGEKLSLTPSEFKLLQALMRNQGRVLSRDRLIELVQGEGVSVVDRAIDTHVFGLRKKLGSHADFIETVRGVGYRMKGDE
jgi:two-component system phosphate regulon response regulator PhoB